MVNEAEPFRERRRGPDPLVRSLRWLGGLGWLAMLAALVFLDLAKPEIETFFERWYQIRLRTTWDLQLARYLFYSMLAGLAFSLAGLAANLRRRRRSSDEIRVSLVALAVISLLGILRYLSAF
ncbi:hypothetical protein DESUT3_00470 [Desulfuromonas versatilis]|uniref:Uncharacterized protein n=1 Tax=Desulfuromonas versatilis TaxID=2802975 RepID=A0ABM8HR20_9BACT|nr:hypothetical protein [Desulfuromonas versatilis]BCR02978.1 hypothetical protein DESUT3_00470 [Desulfuromonas versatilis]